MKKEKVFTPTSLMRFLEREVVVRAVLDVEGAGRDKWLGDVTLTLLGHVDDAMVRATLQGHLRRVYPKRPKLAFHHKPTSTEMFETLKEEDGILCRTTGGAPVLTREERLVAVYRYKDGRIEDAGNLLMLSPYFGWFAAALMGEYREHNQEHRPFGAHLQQTMDRFFAFVHNQMESAAKEARKLV